MINCEHFLEYCKTGFKEAGNVSINDVIVAGSPATLTRDNLVSLKEGDIVSFCYTDQGARYRVEYLVNKGVELYIVPFKNVKLRQLVA